MFTLENSYNEILNEIQYSQMSMLLGTMLFSNECITSLIPKSYYDVNMQKVMDEIKTPWGASFPSNEVVEAANLCDEIFDETQWEIRALWHDGTVTDFDNTKQGVCLFTPVMNDDVERPAVIICPGGAYCTLAMVNEGFGMAQQFIQRGYRPYILRYRLFPNAFPCPQNDLTLALMNVRSHAKKDCINVSDVMIIGFSAGGHLCASTVTHMDDFKAAVLEELGENRRLEYENIPTMPEKMCLGYALVDMERSKDQLGMCDGTTALYYSSNKNVLDNLPKTYAWACEDDPLVPFTQSTRWHEALEAVGGKSMCHIFPQGGHGISDGQGTSAEGWIDEMLEFMAE